MSKVRIVTPPSFGLICDGARKQQEPIEYHKPKDYLHTGLGQRFVSMISDMAALAHLNLSDSDDGPIEPIDTKPQEISQENQLQEITLEARPRINIPGPKKVRRRRRNRIKRTWKTSHATWTNEPTVDPYSILERESAIERNQFLSELSRLKPNNNGRVRVVKRKEKQKTPPSRYSSSSSSSNSCEDVPIPQPKKTAVAPTRSKAPSPPKAPVEEPVVVPAKEPKLVHIPTLITPDMVQWLRNSGMFSIKPKSQVAWTYEEQLQSLSEI
ncbi:hypothetical protein THRCLA_00002 [Thraustotheca clavata]|uniref:Uncharacterized protein n=1 Tax=Thraustotheca clavata TaxID=74557 RepID=A0A1W0ACI3_9STRA|nr:hypothetical protein THRCLA_00002 [Thraustotheca clavata]